MLILATATDKIQLVTSAAANIDVVASFIDYASTVSPATDRGTPGNKATNIATATTTDIVSATGSATIFRNVRGITIRNKHASTACDVTPQIVISSVAYGLCKFTLQPGDLLQFIEGVGWWVTGKSTILNYFSTADQQIAASTTALLTGSLITVPAGKLQIGTVMLWRMTLSKSAAGTLTCNFDVRVGTAGTSGDTSRLSFATPTATGVVDTAWIEILVTCRGPLSASGVFQGQFALDHNLAATGFATIPSVVINTTSAAFDVTTENLFVSVSCTTAASTVLTFQQVVTQVFNL